LLQFITLWHSYKHPGKEAHNGLIRNFWQDPSGTPQSIFVSRVISAVPYLSWSSMQLPKF
ncbi:MAG: hypothetical protein WCR46_25690, partial [Deltaproteobacteria bacterium]